MTIDAVFTLGNSLGTLGAWQDQTPSMVMRRAWPHHAGRPFTTWSLTTLVEHLRERCRIVIVALSAIARNPRVRPLAALVE